MLGIADTLLLTGIASTATLFVTYLFAWLYKRLDIMSTGWGISFVAVAGTLYIAVGTPSPRFIVLAAIISIWGLRLWFHALRRLQRWTDWRLERYEERWGSNAWRYAPFGILIPQAFLISVIALPLAIAAASEPQTLGWPVWLGFFLWVTGFYIEIVSDGQLEIFLRQREAPAATKKARKKQRTILSSGMWRYSRHPNYFGELCQWWGIFFIVLRLPFGPWAILSPLMLTYLIIFITGLYPMERRFKDNKPYKRYVKRTSSLIPLPPKE